MWGPNVCSLPGFATQISCEAPGGDWISAKCSSVFQKNAVEVLKDYIGNDNGLCESDEMCLFTPNIGSYQGHGELETVASIGEDTILKRIELVRWVSKA